VDEDDFRKLEAAGSELSFGAGQILIERGTPGTGLYVVLEGHIVVEAPEGALQLGPSAVVGERALFSEDGLRAARVRGLTYGKLLAVDRAEVERLCAEDPGFAERLAQSGA
jgi:CRP-like cAMP-binding protein